MTRTTIHTVPSTAKIQPTPASLTRHPSLMVSRLPEIAVKGTLYNSRRNAGFERPSTPQSNDSSPPNEPPEFVSRPQDLSDDDNGASRQQVPQKKGGYYSRIEQILYENQDLQILITDAGKSHENGGSYIAYTIRTGVCLTCLRRLRC